MDPVDILAPVTLMAIAAIIAVAVVKVARLRAARSESLPADVAGRLEALERGLQALQEEPTETQERLDFTERVLGKAREERHIGG